jgi:hypothetical protein
MLISIYKLFGWKIKVPGYAVRTFVGEDVHILFVCCILVAKISILFPSIKVCIDINNDSGLKQCTTHCVNNGDVYAEAGKFILDQLGMKENIGDTIRNLDEATFKNVSSKVLRFLKINGKTITHIMGLGLHSTRKSLTVREDYHSIVEDIMVSVVLHKSLPQYLWGLPNFPYTVNEIFRIIELKMPTEIYLVDRDNIGMNLDDKFEISVITRGKNRKSCVGYTIISRGGEKNLADYLCFVVASYINVIYPSIKLYIVTGDDFGYVMGKHLQCTWIGQRSTSKIHQDDTK